MACNEAPLAARADPARVARMIRLSRYQKIADPCKSVVHNTEGENPWGPIIKDTSDKRHKRSNSDANIILSRFTMASPRFPIAALSRRYPRSLVEMETEILADRELLDEFCISLDQNPRP